MIIGTLKIGLIVVHAWPHDCTSKLYLSLTISLQLADEVLFSQREGRRANPAS